MRVSNRVARLGAGAVVTVALIAACASPPPPSAAPTVLATPVITPEPHLTEPATADEVFRALRSGDLNLQVNNASEGGPGEPLVKKINAAVGDWPLVISQYSTGVSLRGATDWNPAKAPVQGNPPYAWVGLNILVEFGPVTGLPAAPDFKRQEQAQAIVAILDPLLWPLEQRSMVPVATRTAPPPSASAPASASAKP
jgi:hypothetical protein